MRRFSLWLAVTASALALTGCPKVYPNCDSDEACKEKSEVCVQGQCQECATDANCKEGFSCQGNRCVPKEECKDDSACPSGQKCRAGKCSTNECTSDGECGTGKCRANKCVAANSCRTNEDCPGDQECTEGVCGTKTASCDYQPVRFGFNDYALDAESRGRLEQIADCIKKQGAKVTLEGHADERGTEEYNLQLSNRRAAAVKKYLADLGVQGAKLDTVGYGENRPAMQGSSEDAWSANRRVEFRR